MHHPYTAALAIENLPMKSSSPTYLAVLHPTSVTRGAWRAGVGRVGKRRVLGPWRQSRHGDRGVEREGRPEPYETVENAEFMIHTINQF